MKGIFRRHSSICFTAAVLLIFLLCIGLLPTDFLESGKEFLPEVVRQYGFVSSSDQRWAHLLAVLAVAAFSATAFFLGRRCELRDYKVRLRLGSVGCLLLSALGLSIYWFYVPRVVVGVAVPVIFVILLFVTWAPRFSVPMLDRTATGLIGAYLLFLIGPGLMVNPIPLMEIDPVAVSQFETHLLYLPMRGPAVAAGQNFFRELPLGYGLLMPSIMSVIDLRGHGLTIGAQLRIIQICQALFSVAAVCAYIAYRPRNYIGVLAALLLAGPYWTTAGLGIWHANQTGFRSLGLPLGMLALMLAGRLPLRRAAWWLGGTVGLALLMNPETAVAVLSGYAIFMIVRTRSIPVSLFVRMACACAFAMAAYLVLYRMALGRLPFSLLDLDFLATVKRHTEGGAGSRLFSSGYDREGYYLVPFALLMFAHAIYAVIHGFRRLGDGVLPLRTAFRTSTAFTLVVWFAYYFNQPNWWQIWTLLFLYGFLIVDLVDRRLIGAGVSTSAQSILSRLKGMHTAAASFILMFFFAVLTPHTNRHLFKYMSDFMYPWWLSGPREVSVLSGVLMPTNIANLLQRKATRLKELHSATNGQLMYFTFNMSFIPELTRLFQPAPYRDMWEIPDETDFRRTIAEVLRRRPKVILIDAPTGALALSGPRKDFQDRLRSAISPAYGVTATEDGWQVWRPSS